MFLLLTFWTSLGTWLTPSQVEPVVEQEPLWTVQVENVLSHFYTLASPSDAHFEYTNKRLILVPEKNALHLTTDLLLASMEEQTVTEADLEPRKAQVEQLLNEGVVLTLDGEDWALPTQLKDLTFTKTETGLEMSLTPEFMSYVLSSAQELIDRDVQDITLLKVSEGQEANQENGKAFKVDLEGNLTQGKKVSTLLLEVALIKTIQEGQTAQEVPVTRTEGKIINQTGLDLGPLQELAEGKTTYWGSSPEREFNIEKALNEHFDGIVIPPGAEFSYVEFLGPIEGGGWKQAYTIFKGTQLEKAPAGGVCQVSTTIYRAALDAGLTLTEQRHHSLYVVYYNDYGDGLDATVFPGEQDFKFLNNTPNDLLLITQEEGYYEAVARFYGEDDGRETTLIGPYTASNQTEESEAALGYFGIGDMAWKYLITWGDGSSEESWIHSSYMSIAKQHREDPSELSTDHL